MADGLNDAAALPADDPGGSLPPGPADIAIVRDTLDAVPHMVWSTRPDGYHDFYNQRWYDFTGMPAGSTDGEAWNGMFHAEDRPRAWGVWRQSLTSGEPYEIEYRLRHHSGEYRWVLGRAMPMRDETGRIVRWVGTCTDIDDRKRAEAGMDLIARELSHRINNIFAVLISLLSSTARFQPEAAGFVRQVSDKVRALAKAHALVRRPAGDGAAEDNLHRLLRELLSPYEIGGQPRIALTGDDLALGIQAAGALALVVHELATNALKYGALSLPGGTVTLTCQIADGHLHLAWREQGGPPVAGPPSRSGFGTEMKHRAAIYQLRGTLTEHWHAHGLAVDMVVPLDALRH